MKYVEMCLNNRQLKNRGRCQIHDNINTTNLAYHSNHEKDRAFLPYIFYRFEICFINP